MAKKLVIVESPSKSKTIEKYLGKDYKVVSSKGHIRDLATTGKYGLGIDVEHDFKPTYVPIEGKKRLIEELKKEVKSSEKVYLATDPDREGEAISWHLLVTLGIDPKNYERVLFHEITKNKVIEAFDHPLKIDDNLVHSQETRRMLDRIIGFRLSKLMQSKTGGKSAGRVQSVALKLIVDREREIEAFQKEEYWTITSHFDSYDSSLFQKDHKNIEIKTEQEADKILNDLSSSYVVESIQKTEKKKKAKPPFITSTLQQDASTKLNFPAKKTMSIAQKLYEGVDLGNETVGLITYMRTDSIRLSNEFISSCYQYIEENYGKDLKGSVKVSKKTENVQDAHEAIRPTSILRTPSSVKKYLSNDEYKLYAMIYARSLASLMKDATVLSTTMILNNNNYQFKTTGQILVKEGYLTVYKDYEKSEDKILPELKEGEKLTTTDVEKEQHFTQPPSRYTEAKLIKEMEELGIGRPSTYAKTIDTLKEREYVTLEDKKFVPTPVGIESTDKLQEFFSNIINVEYTANMESDLDKIADGKLKELELLHHFYDEFEPLVQTAFHGMEKKEAEKTGEECPLCHSPLVIRKGKYGEFVACSNYPTCKYIKKEEKQEEVVARCPSCGGNLIRRTTKKGKEFFGCSNFPKCKMASWDLPVGRLCPKCNNLLVQKDNVVQCSNCDYVEK